MKKLYNFLLLMILGMSIYSQQIPMDTVKNKEYYLQKKSTQRTTGWIFFGLGGAALITGTIMYASQPIFSSDKNNTGAIIAGVGALSMLASIPFFISSHQSNLKAMQLSVSPKMEKNDQLIQKYVGVYQPAISLKINFK